MELEWAAASITDRPVRAVHYMQRGGMNRMDLLAAAAFRRKNKC